MLHEIKEILTPIHPLFLQYAQKIIFKVKYYRHPKFRNSQSNVNNEIRKIKT